MPHFFATQIDNIKYPVVCGDFEFICEAKSLFDNNSIILVLHNGEHFLFFKQYKGGKILLKYNKHLKVRSIDIVKRALNIYAEIANAKILSHNLNIRKQTKLNQYFLNILDINEFLESTNNLSIEIGFGSGRHILNLAKNNPNSIFLGIEIYRPAIEQVLNQIDILGLKNLFVMNADCRNLFEILPSNAIDSIYLHFPIPWDKNPQKRVFSKIFLDECCRILKKYGFLELRTDSKEYFLYALDIAKKYQNIQIESNLNTQATIISKYEARWINQNKDIFNAKFILKDCIKDNVKNAESLKIILESIDMGKILKSRNLKSWNEECFLHIKSIYQSQFGYILFVLFGAFNTPNKIYLVVSNEGEVNILGDIIPTKSNVNALKMLVKLYGVD
ncbi:tRNA (guanosine(46)-N7)-methyltransferase TrmB [Helicobacter sp. 16-1353]|uniref:tRNA (guanosine(46)-N7)-methyltransferase TrmB n=1 Tax=Helicobacter sp. 16-1353 TaxID=2004996 RepID=UPI000DCB4C57|nr:tRNA (guanosine(46)-N7)-methyltransferase TrmB [Helicobacter sp. 16-1353]RAX53182.1 tRNA (guanosine(46)-N7)-methyltransferase TrmB [Helicobacter sp. 16-1353]